MESRFVGKCLLAIGVYCGWAPGEAVAQNSKSATDQQATVVFVCEQGSAKSVVAAAHFNRLAEQKDLPFRATARGTKPDDAVAGPVQKNLAAEGLDVHSWTPASLSEQEIRRAVRVVSITTDLPTTRSFEKVVLVEWNNIPPIGEDYDAARKAIIAQVEALIKSLSTPQKR